jgi:ABC-2 type transport system permease protein
VAYLLALITIAVLYASGISLGVHLTAGEWVRMTALVLVGLVPFAALGVLMGHLLTTDSIGPAMGGTTALLSLLGGVWFPITSGTMHDIAEALPSYWLVQASRVSIGGGGWGRLGWLVVAAWTVVLTAAAARVYQRDTQRV